GIHTGPIVTGNIISENTTYGLTVRGDNNNIQDNKSGTSEDGTPALGNSAGGIHIVPGTVTTTISNNVIAFNGGDGITADNSFACHISANSIFANAGLGINVVNSPPPPPVITSAVSSGGNTMIMGTVDHSFNSGSDITVEFFANPDCDPSGFGE